MSSKLLTRSVTILMLLALVVPAVSQAGVVPRRKVGVDQALARILETDQQKVGVIVRFIDQPTAADAKALQDAGFLPGMIRYSVVPAIYAEGSVPAIRSILKNPRVRYIEHDAVIPYALDRATTATRANEVWDAQYKLLGDLHEGGFTGRGVGVAVVDSGIDASHPDLLWKPLADATALQATTIRNYKIQGRDSIGLVEFAGLGEVAEANTLVVDAPDTDTTGGHGTHVAGSVAGNGYSSGGKYKGAAPEANLIGYGAGETLLIHLGLAAFDHIHRNHEELNIRVVNNSWGGAGDWNPESSVTIAAQRLVNEDGIAVVFAAGNSGGDGSDIQSSVWGNIPEVIQVANYYDRRGWVDDSSSRGKRSIQRTWPHLAAPGTQIISTAANGKPVTMYGTAQDAAIAHIEGYDEPAVVPAPVPVTVEASPGGKDVMVGNYASFTGTSMAAPFVSGVAALVLEANPALTPFQLRDLLQGTANMPQGRTYQDDGYAIGSGVVDATEAVAAALKMREGLSLQDALGNAYVELGSPTKLNVSLPRRLDITSPTENANLFGTSVTVSGDFKAGPMTDQSIPLAPPPAPPVYVSGAAHIYQGGALDPFALDTDKTVVLPGEPVGLSVRQLKSENPDITLTASNFTPHFMVTRGGETIYGPIAGEPGADGALYRADADWQIPADAAGRYVLEGYVVYGGNTYLADTMTFTVGADAGSLSGSSSVDPLKDMTVNTVFFGDGFESGGEGWTKVQDGFGPGLLTAWSLIDEDSMLTWAGTYTGDKAFYVGNQPGTPYMSGLYYEDMADTSLISPVIDLSSANSAALSYYRAGQSEFEFDFLGVYVSTGGDTWTKVDEVSGDILFGGSSGSWEQSVVDLTPYLGESNVRLKFRFTSDDLTAGFNLAGWTIDDVQVVGESGDPVTIIEPSITARPTFGVGGLTTKLSFSAVSNSTIDGYEVDFGDGSAIHSAAAAGAIEHTYAPGSYFAEVTAFSGTASDTAKVLIDVAPVNGIQVRFGGGAWVDAGSALDSDSTFSAELPIEGGVLPGEKERVRGEFRTIEVRHCDAQARCIYDRVRVTVAL